MNDFTINIQELDKEWMMLPRVYSEYSDLAESEDANLRKNKVEIEMRSAEIAREIRENSKEYCKQYGVNNITEGFINTIVNTDERIREMMIRGIALERNKKLYSSAVKSLEMKRDALKALVQLYQSEFFTVQNVERKAEEYNNINADFENRNLKKEVRMRLRKSQEKKEKETEK